MSLLGYLYERASMVRELYPYRPYMLRHRCIFIHIPKTAGTSILMALNGMKKVPRDHALWIDFASRSQRKFREYYSFCVVRDPIERYLSAFYYLNRGGSQRENDIWMMNYLHRGDFTASSFAESLRDNPSFILRHRLLWPQFVFVCDHNLSLMINSVLKFETLDDDYEQIKSRLGLPDLPHVNRMQGQRKGDLSAQAVATLRSIYKIDFDTFGY